MTRHGDRTVRTRNRDRSACTLTRWAVDGKTSLREITPTDGLAALLPSGAPRAVTGKGLRSLFHVSGAAVAPGGAPS
ncbi:hypothetical protein ACH4S8_43730 [Streptomyces sp. NPDC021080]|uniref:hypothetical protein n=1 Tax=Streptomyces sp. NPDC021080 TaxID=3365110 RepID=UPI00378B9D78